jgi:hypothetical protein
VSYETAEHDTHIPRHHLQALEEERFEAFHAPVYVRGFLRSYSQYLRLDSSELLALLPPDRPVEDDRLMPLSRLGHPRGPREAARERHDPEARDAPPLTSAAFHHAARRRYALEEIDELPALEQPDGGESPNRIVPRLDPLGRLGWPESPDEPLGHDDSREDTPRQRVSFSKQSWEQPLSPRRTRHWDASSRPHGLLPDDMRPILSQRSLLAIVGGACALALLLAVALALGAADSSPTVLASAASSTTVKIPLGTGQPGAHGPMPNVLGTDLNTALAALQKSGVVPVVLAESGGDPGGLPVKSQVPNPGAELRADTPVLLVVRSGS